MKTVESEKWQAPAFHTKGVRWRYTDGTVLVIGADGSARREEPRVRMSKKARKRQRDLDNYKAAMAELDRLQDKEKDQ